MNKAKKGALGAAGVGVVALAMFGGGTFASWSDFQNLGGNDVGAGMLKLVVGDNGVTESLNPGNLAPGENKFQDVYVASNDGASVPDGDLYVTLKGLVDKEDGCTNTNGEKAVDSDCTWNQVGDFSKEARVQVVSYEPSAPGQCSTTGANVKSTNPQGTGLLSGVATQRLHVDTLTPGEGICVRVEVSLPKTATNAVQGDSTTFDALFELDQVTS